MSADEPAPPPPPIHFGIGGATAFTLGAWMSAIFVAALFIEWASAPTALAIGVAAGFGGIGTLLARRLPPPAEARIGLRGFAPRLLFGLLLLVPASLLMSEIDNVVKAGWPVAEASGAGDAPAVEPAPEATPGDETAGEPDDDAPRPITAWLLVEAVIAMVLLRPVVEEFFFRGVIQQGLVARHGAALGVLGAALLSGLSEAAFNLPIGSAVAASALAQGLFQGALLGWVRLASRSLLAPILLQAATRGSGGLAVVFAESLPIPGFNTGGSHTPAGILLPALLSVALGVAWLARFSRSRGREERQNPRERPGGRYPDGGD